jgi:hypothetical protein
MGNPNRQGCRAWSDTGKAPWESRLIERLRRKHYTWRAAFDGVAAAVQICIASQNSLAPL